MALFVSSERQESTNFAHAYEVAGQRLYSQQLIALIDAFEVDLQPSEIQPFLHDPKLTMDAFDAHSAILVYQGEGSFSGGMKKVSVWESDNVQLLKVGLVNFSLTNLSTGHIRLLGDYQAIHIESAEILLGPPLLTLFATQSIFCLHAGAVFTEHGAAVFIGESGKGKSTLSESVPEKGWHRLGDDIMPISFREDRGSLIPRFPQLKRQQQYLDVAEKPLSAIFRLLKPAVNDQVEFQLVTGSEALITLARHTAASRVFNEKILADNMAFNQKVVSAIPIYNLSYPRNFKCLGAVRDEIMKKMFELHKKH